ncbi:hypothetical protein AJ80_07430 [Polytolypa hystricis UAMH7299]|uniref:Uncharacterized protein n=1 Tax=Polytolypa hystricis (strain UAMH7299) TaxID=1447883 RepID=A0A2B7XG27_POLH7|nr:hypothetical protein AJ80_07430 [Polytolypa hystricis UAMH7299]
MDDQGLEKVPDHFFSGDYVCPGEYLLDRYPGIQPSLNFDRVEADYSHEQATLCSSENEEPSPLQIDDSVTSKQYISYGYALGDTDELMTSGNPDSPLATSLERQFDPNPELARTNQLKRRLINGPGLTPAMEIDKKKICSEFSLTADSLNADCSPLFFDTVRKSKPRSAAQDDYWMIPFNITSVVRGGEPINNGIKEKARGSVPRKRDACLSCRISHRLCTGEPLCGRCVNRCKLPHQPSIPKPEVFDVVYLDRELWQEIYDNLSVVVAVLSTRHVQHSLRGKAPLLLDIIVQGSPLDKCHTLNNVQSVYLDTLATLDHPALIIGQQKRPPRKPALNVSQFDAIARDMVWPNEKGRKENLANDEIGVFATARLFCGYCAILHELHRTSIRTTYGDKLASKFIGLELTYFVVYRITTLHSEIMTQIQTRMLQRKCVDDVSIGLCALEIVYRCMRSFGTITWDVPHNHVLHPMQQMRATLNSRSKYILSLIEEYECRLSLTRRRFTNIPILRLVRSKSFDLPGALVIAHQRIQRVVLPWNIDPLRAGYSPGHGLVDLLGCRRELELEAASGRSAHRRLSGVERTDLTMSLCLLKTQSKLKWPKAHHEEAPETIQRHD